MFEKNSNSLKQRHIHCKKVFFVLNKFNIHSKRKRMLICFCFACSTSEFEFCFFSFGFEEWLVDGRKVAAIRVKILKEFSSLLKDIEGNFCLKIEFSLSFFFFLVKECSLS